MKGVLDGLQRDDVRQINGCIGIVCSVVIGLIYVTLSSLDRQVLSVVVLNFMSCGIFVKVK